MTVPTIPPMLRNPQCLGTRTRMGTKRPNFRAATRKILNGKCLKNHNVCSKLVFASKCEAGGARKEGEREREEKRGRELRIKLGP